MLNNKLVKPPITPCRIKYRCTV